MTPSPKKHDHFAAIGSLHLGHQEGLAPLEPVLKQRKLITARDTKTRELPPAPEKLSEEPHWTQYLANLRKERAVFFEQYAPPSQPFTSRQTLTAFSWQCEKGGAWQEVTLPHYGEPIGPATTTYRTTFNLDKWDNARQVPYVQFEAVDYIAHVFINDEYVGSHEGFFAPFAFNISSVARPGKNTLVVKVENNFTCLGESQHHSAPDIDGDKIYAATNQGYDEPISGWHHCPPGMGIPGKVYFELRPALHLDDLFVRPLSDLKSAELWVEVTNTSLQVQALGLGLSIYGDNFPAVVLEEHTLWNELQTGKIADASTKRQMQAGPGRNFFRFTISLPDPRLWTPETPWLYQAQVQLVKANGEVCDHASRSFGMRTFSLAERDDRQGMPMLNGQPIRLRGANTMGHEQRCVIQEDFAQLREDLLLAKACHINYLRFTQRPVQAAVYDACDRMGILTQTDLPLFGYLRRNQFAEAVRQAQEMERIVRAHPCNVLVSFINEPFPDERARRTHRHLERVDLERFFRAATEAIAVENPDRVVKPVDGDYNPPTWGLPDNHCYTLWYLGHGIDPGKLHKGFWQACKQGWHYGCGEFGAEGLDRLELMQRHCPPDWLPKDEADAVSWTPRRIPSAQSYRFGEFYFDPPQSIEEWVEKSRQHQAEATTWVTEAFRRDPRNVSCAIHLFIDAWPTGWMKAIVDTDRHPKPAYFAYREALKPLKLSLRSDRNQLFAGEDHLIDLWICNDTLRSGLGQIDWFWQTGEAAQNHSGSLSCEVTSCAPTYEGTFTLQAPQVNVRTRCKLTAILRIGDEEVSRETQVVEVFPSLPQASDERKSQIENNKAVNDFFAAFAVDENVICFCRDFAAYAHDRDRYESLVQRGATVVFLELPEGEYVVHGHTVRVKRASLSPRYFVSRDTGHPLVEDFAINDFAWWYDARHDRFGPVASTILETDRMNAILTTTNQGWRESNRPHVLIAGELTCGLGRVVICQLHLINHYRHNPTAALFAQRLLSHPQSAKLIPAR